MPTTIKLVKGDATTPWGFRLHGGKDFGAPLTVQRINPGSVAAKCGLLIGDLISKIDETSTSGLKHKDAQDLIVKGGNSIVLTICRGSEQPIQNVNITTNVTETKQFGYNYDTPNQLASDVSALKISKPYETQQEFRKASITDTTTPVPYQLLSYQTKAYSPSGYQPSVSSNSTYKTTTPAGTNDPKPYIPSETCRFVQDMEAGKDLQFNPKTGVEVKSSPIQSKLLDILDKKHGSDQFRASPVRDTAQSRNVEKNDSVPSNVPKFSASTPNAYSPQQPAANRDFKKNLTTQHAKSMPAPSGAGLAGNKVPICNVCNSAVRGPYLMAVNKIWCPEHFLCSNPGCQRPLAEGGFVEEDGQLFCLEDYEKYFAPRCNKCNNPIIGDTVKAMQKTYHPNCFVCKQCQQPIMGGSFHLNQGDVYCDKDYSALFSTKCFGCQFPIEMGDNWIEALGQNWHGECFNCTTCNVNLENQGFVNKGGRPYCKEHAAGARV